MRPPARDPGLTTFRAFAATAAALCLLALADLPYGYYTALRVAVCATAAWGAVLARDDAGGVWAVALALVAVAFNPVVPVALPRGAWAPVDVAAAAVLLGAAARSRRWAPAP